MIKQVWNIIDQELHKMYLDQKNNYNVGALGGLAALAPIFSFGTSLFSLFGGGQPSAPTPTPLPAPPTTSTPDVAAQQTAEQQQRAAAVGLSQTNTSQGTIGDPTSNQLSRPTLLGG